MYHLIIGNQNIFYIDYWVHFNLYALGMDIDGNS